MTTKISIRFFNDHEGEPCGTRRIVFYEVYVIKFYNILFY